MRGLTTRAGTAGFVLLLAAVGLVFWAVNAFYFVYESAVLHSLFRLVGVGASLLLAWLSFRTFRTSGSTRVLSLGAGFLLIGALDLVNAIAVAGTPELLVSRLNFILYYWVPGHLIGTLVLLAGALYPERELPVAARAGVGRAALAGALILAGGLVVLSGAFSAALSPMYATSVGPTPLRVSLSYAIVLVYAATAVVYLRSFLARGRELTYLFAMGLALLAFSELAFTLYKSPFEGVSWAGEVFRLTAFAAVGYGLYRLLYGKTLE